jgi:hypothetical protein
MALGPKRCPLRSRLAHRPFCQQSWCDALAMNTTEIRSCKTLDRRAISGLRDGDQAHDTHSIEDFRHAHVFLGEAHARNERKTWTVIAICTAMMVAEIIGGFWFGSVALIADGLHMSTHAGALLIAALAYTYSRRYAGDERFVFGTGKLGDLAAFTSAIALGMTHIRSMTLLPPVKCGRIVAARWRTHCPMLP